MFSSGMFSLSWLHAENIAVNCVSQLVPSTRFWAALLVKSLASLVILKLTRDTCVREITDVKVSVACKLLHKTVMNSKNYDNCVNHGSSLPVWPIGSGRAPVA
jgi:hypothetical protein